MLNVLDAQNRANFAIHIPADSTCESGGGGTYRVGVPLCSGSFGGMAAMNEIEERVQEIMDEYGELVMGEEPQVEEFKRAVQDFLEHGPGMPDQRRQSLLKHMRGWDPEYIAYLTKRG